MPSEQGAILLAEDRGSDILLIEEAFKRTKLRNRLLVVKSGRAVLDYLQGNGKYSDRARWPFPALLLLDLMLPELDGFEVLEWMRQRAAFDGVIAVVLTVYNQIQNIDRAYQLGANSFLAKPPDFDGFEEVCLVLVNFWLKHNVPAGRSG